MRLITQERERGQNLAKTVVEGKSFDSELLHPLQLLFIEVLKFIPEKKYFKKSDFWTFGLLYSHREKSISIKVHAAEPVFDCSGMSFVLERCFEWSFDCLYGSV